MEDMRKGTRVKNRERHNNVEVRKEDAEINKEGKTHRGG